MNKIKVEYEGSIKNEEIYFSKRGKYFPRIIPVDIINKRKEEKKIMGFVPYLIYDDLIELFGDYISVHVRRFSGIKYDEDDLLELPEEVREEYAEESYFYDDSWTWKFIKDQEYFNQLDQYPGCKFYVSTDLPRRYYYSKWSERYPIITMDDVTDQFRSIMVKYYGEESVKRNWNLIYRMIDYFGIMYSKETLCAKHYKAKSISLWSWSATKIGPTKRTIFEAGYL